MIIRDGGQSERWSIGTVVNRDRGQLGRWSIGTVANRNRDQSGRDCGQLRRSQLES